jgi:hypothetical protein
MQVPVTTPAQDPRRFSSAHLPPPPPEMFTPSPQIAPSASNVPNVSTAHSYSSSYPSRTGHSSRAEPVHQLLQSFDDKRTNLSERDRDRTHGRERSSQSGKKKKKKKEPKDIFKRLLGLRWDFIIEQLAEACHQRQR